MFKSIGFRSVGQSRLSQTRLGKALVVEDDIWLKPVIELALLQTYPIVHVDWVETVDDAIKKVQSTDYQLIVADIFLKGSKTGLDFWDHCHEVRPETTVLLTSAIPIELFLERSAHGRDNPLYLPKPFSLEELMRTVHGLLDFSGATS
jgi:DNA-binding response OmpR family regulator